MLPSLFTGIRRNLASAFPQGFRLITTTTAAFPQNLLGFTNNQKALNLLKGEAEGGCQKSGDLLNALDVFKQRDYKALHVTGSPTDRKEAEEFAGLITSLTDVNLDLNHCFEVGGKGDNPLMPHKDGSRWPKPEELEFSLLVGIKSKGIARTFLLDLEKLHESLSEETREILAQPIFSYLSEDPTYVDSLDPNSLSRILYEEDGTLKINFAYALRGFLAYDNSSTPYSKEQIDTALDEIHSRVDEMYRNNELKSFYLKGGEALIFKNCEILHGRDSEVEDPDREILFFSYRKSRKEEKVEDSRPPQTTTQISASHNINTKMNLRSLYRELKKLHLHEMSPQLLDGPLWKLEGDGQERRLYLLKDGEWSEKTTMQARYDQGAIIHGEEMFYEALKKNCQAKLDEGSDNANKKTGWISMEGSDTLLFKRGYKDSVKLEELPQEEVRELLGEKLAQKVQQYKDKKEKDRPSHDR